MEKRQFSIVILASLLILILVVIFASVNNQSLSKSSNMPEVAYAQAPQLTSVGSPDGKMTLTMRTQLGKDTTTYSFLVSGSTGLQKEVFVKTVPTTDTLSIPQNTFSPDDKYFFLKEVNSTGTSYIVMTTKGTAVAKDVQILEISSLYAAKYPNYKITDVTGWGGPALVVVNVDKADGSQGPSFWFDVSSRSFIQLGTRFN